MLSILKGKVPRVTQRAYHIYVFRYLKEKWQGIEKDKFIEALNNVGRDRFKNKIKEGELFSA